MGSRYQKLEGNADELKRAMENSKNADQYKRYQALYLRLGKGKGVEEIAELTGYSVGWVRGLHSKYRKGGIEALVSQGKGGRRNELLSKEREQELLESFRKEGEAGQILIAAKLQDELEERVGRKVCKASAYNLLKRNGWRKIRPRPRHPKADVEAQAELKKNGQ